MKTPNGHSCYADGTAKRGSSVRLTFWLLGFAGTLVCLAALTGFREQWGGLAHKQLDGISDLAIIRRVRDVGATEIASTTEQPVVVDNTTACTPRSVETFPPDLFTLAQKQQGAVLIHVLAIVWLFAALAIVCENYFVASLEVICESLHLTPDVAGATFMAAGASALELLASVIGVFLAKSDVGVSTIVGSGIFNNLMVSSLCGLAATQVVYLSFWPLFRDCGFYCISVIAFVAIIHDGVVTWYESVILLGLFFSYIVIMVFNSRIDSAIFKRWPRLATGGVRRLHEMDKPGGQGAANNSSAPPKADIWTVHMHTGGAETAGSGDPTVNFGESTLLVTVVDDRPDSPFTVPQGLLRRAHWLFTLPWVAAFYVSIPDCRRPGIRKRLFLLTFLCSVVWISGMIYMLVWMVCVTGDTIGIPDTVMGLTLLAIGTCMPDAMTAVFVSRTGMSEMAIANSIASNVFDITACLGLPWFISTALLYPGSTVVINSSGLTYTAITLLSTIVFLFATICLNKMRVDRKLGIVFLSVYLAIVTVACLYESNVFGPLNPPSCARTRF